MIGDAVRAGLRRQGFSVDWVRDGVAAEQALLTEPYDACLLDLGLPRREGLAVLRRLRERGSMLPVLLVTARDAITDRVEGLDAGADDYVVKPFDLAELGARIRAVTRRKGGRAQAIIVHRDVELDPATREVRRSGELVALSPREFALLHALLENNTRVEHPLWFREGLVEALNGEQGAAGLRAQGLIRRYGRERVLGFWREGLPADEVQK